MDFNSPVGRLVQGSVLMQPQKDMDTNQPIKNDDGSPVLGVFFALAFPKVLPNGAPNSEFDAFFGTIRATAAAAWPTLFPQGANGACVNPRFSWKYQDGDGTDQSGKSVADKAGFKGNHIVKFYTSYPVRCFYEGKFAAHEEIQQPESVIKRGYWVRVFGEVKGNNASGTQVPGVSLYPKLMSFVERGEEIVSGPDAQAAFGAAAVGWRPPASASPVGMPGGMSLPGGPPMAAGVPIGAPRTLPTPPAVGMPGGVPGVPGVPGGMALPGMPGMPPTPPAGPTFVLRPDLVAQGVQIDNLIKQGWTNETLVAQGYATRIG